MTEILTESFCERCGTRYTFEPVVNRRKPLSAIGTLGRGIRHFVSDPGSTLDEAMAVARSETEQRSTASALEAFHRTFNFCLSCRQYTCSDCWNAVEGRCLSCAPTPDAAPPETRMDMAIALPPVKLPQAPPATHAHDPAVGAVGAAAPPLPESDAEAAAAAEWAAVSAAAEAAEAAEAAQVGEPGEPAAAAEQAGATPDAVAAAAAQATADAEAAAIAQAEAAAAEAEARAAAEEAVAAAEERAREEAEEHARAVAEAQARASAEAEAEAIEVARARAEAAAVAASAEAESRAAAEAAAAAAAEQAAAEQAAAERTAAEATGSVLAFEPGLNLDEQIAAYEREHGAAAAEPELPVTAEPGEAAPAATQPEPPIAAEPEPQPTPAELEPIPTAVGQPLPASAAAGPLSWPDTQVAAAAFEPSWPDSAIARSASPQPVAQQSGATPHAAPHGRGAGLPAAEQPAMPHAARACPSCGLSLSASARFCRRCGTPQVVA